jgi:hypothetical protein
LPKIARYGLSRVIGAPVAPKDWRHVTRAFYFHLCAEIAVPRDAAGSFRTVRESVSAEVSEPHVDGHALISAGVVTDESGILLQSRNPHTGEHCPRGRVRERSAQMFFGDAKAWLVGADGYAGILRGRGHCGGKQHQCDPTNS